MVNDLIFKTPEEEGLSSKAILQFLDYVEEHKMNLHSFMLVRHGNIIAEGYFKPFHKDFMHRLYSASKTYVSMAVGKLIGEGRVALSDPLWQYFPEYIEGELPKWLKETTIEDALKMSVPMLTDTYFERDYKEWAWTFFSHPKRSKPLKPAGTVFNYNTSASFILDVLVEKLTGKTFLEYLRPEFDKIGVSKDIWCVKAPDGFSWGGSGVVCTLRDYAKFAELLMHKGEYKGEQLLPRDYVERATSKQIYLLTENVYVPSRDGYGYQVWISKRGFSLKGMGTQLAYCFPDKDFMFVCQGDTQCGFDVTDKEISSFVDRHFYDALQDGPIACDDSTEALKAKLENLTINADFGEAHVPFEQELNGVKYVLEENGMGWKWFRFDFAGDEGTLTYENRRGVKKIPFGLGKYVQGTFPETDYYDVQVDLPSNRELNAMFSANWVEEKKILVRNYIVDTNLGNCFMTFGFKGDEVGLAFNKRAEFFMDDYAGFAGGHKE